MAHRLKRNPDRAGEARQEQPLAAETMFEGARSLDAVVYRVLETHHAARVGPEAFAFS